MTGAMPVTPGHHPPVVSLLTVVKEGAGGKVVGCGSCRLPPKEGKPVEVVPCPDQEQTALSHPGAVLRTSPAARDAGGRRLVPRAGWRLCGCDG